MRIRGLRLLPLLLVLSPGGLVAQLPIPLAIEARAGYAVPRGELADADGGLGAEAGPTFGAALRVDVTPAIGLFAGYQQTNFGCDRCGQFLLEESVALKGVEAGVQLSMPLAVAGVTPWIRGSMMRQTLGFSGQGETRTSEAALGFNVGAGFTARFADRFELSPGLRYISAPAEFEFTTLPDREIDVAAFAIDITVAVRL